MRIEKKKMRKDTTKVFRSLDTCIRRGTKKILVNSYIQTQKVDSLTYMVVNFCFIFYTKCLCVYYTVKKKLYQNTFCGKEMGTYFHCSINLTLQT